MHAIVLRLVLEMVLFIEAYLLVVFVLCITYSRVVTSCFGNNDELLLMACGKYAPRLTMLSTEESVLMN